MTARPPADDGVDALHAALVAAGESPAALREALERRAPDATLLLSVLRRAVPARLLEMVAATPPWSSDPRLLAGVVLSPRAARALSLRLLPSLFWRDLADVATSPRVDASVRVRAEALLRDQLPDLRLGERITLARIATPPVLSPLLLDSDPKVLAACLFNPRLREEDLATVVRQDTVSRPLLEAIAGCARWTDSYRLKLELVLQPRTPLAIALAQISSLVPADLTRVAGTEGLAPLVQMAAQRVAREREG